MDIVIVDQIGLCYDGNTLESRGLGGSESAVILIAKHLAQLGMNVFVVNNCKDGQHSKEGMFDNVCYIDNSNSHLLKDKDFDIAVVSRTVEPFISGSYPFVVTAKKKILWLHDTFVQGDQLVEDLVLNGKIDHIFTLSDWHTNYILNADHGKRRNYEVLKKKIFQTRNGAVCHIPEVDLSKKDKFQFVYNASATKGLIPLVEKIWPRIKQEIPAAKLKVIGGYYRFRENAAPDEQEKTVTAYANSDKLRDLGIEFTGVIPQKEIAEILAKSWMMLYPGAFPETFGISSLESLLYKTPIATTRFGALEETAIDLACYKLDYAITPNSLFPNIDENKQVDLFVQMVLKAWHTDYLHQQKQNYCDVIRDISGWDTVALQWKEFFYKIMGKYLRKEEYRRVKEINEKVARVFRRVNTMPASNNYSGPSIERRIVVISPFWNAEEYVGKNVDSVAAQDYDNYLHILINDASTDKSEEIVASKATIMPTVVVKTNKENKGAICNIFDAVREYVRDDDIVMLLDGDDWLINNPTIFKYYNSLYAKGIEFTYGSMWSLTDGIPLIAQDYPEIVKAGKTYRHHLFNWKIPYTHLRTVLGKHILEVDKSKFKKDGKWIKAGADNPLFYELIERVDKDKIYCNKEIVVVYNDKNPLNDYKINPIEQNENASISYKKNEVQMKRILVAIPTNKNIEADTFKSLWDLYVPEGYELDYQHFHGYQIDQVRNLIAEWAKRYDYLLSVDSDIVLPNDALLKMLSADKDIVSGLYIQRKPGQRILEVYMDAPGGGYQNIPPEWIENRQLSEIAACGMGCALIKSDVFRKLDYPHFVYTSALDHRNTFSEDIYFCDKARKHGFTVWADPTIKCDHVGSTVFALQTASEKNIEHVHSLDLLPKEHVSYIESMDLSPVVIYDIGACVLHWERHAKRIWPNSKIFVFDANKDLEKLYIKEGKEHYLGVLSDKDGRLIDFYMDPFNLGGNSYYKENTAAYQNVKATKEVGVTLDSVVAQKGWPLPDLIKLDVQGAEMDILKGATYCLTNCKDIILEAQKEDYNSGAPKLNSIIEFMQSIGFELVKGFSLGDIDGDYHFRKKS